VNRTPYSPPRNGDEQRRLRAASINNIVDDDGDNDADVESVVAFESRSVVRREAKRRETTRTAREASRESLENRTRQRVNRKAYVKRYERFAVQESDDGNANRDARVVPDRGTGVQDEGGRIEGRIVEIPPTTWPR